MTKGGLEIKSTGIDSTCWELQLNYLDQEERTPNRPEKRHFHHEITFLQQFLLWRLTKRRTSNDDSVEDQDRQQQQTLVRKTDREDRDLETPWAQETAKRRLHFSYLIFNYICFKILKLKTLYKLSIMLILLKIIDIWHACQYAYFACLYP